MCQEAASRLVQVPCQDIGYGGSSMIVPRLRGMRRQRCGRSGGTLGTAASQPQRRTAGRADLAATPGAAADGSVAQSQTKQHDAAVSGVGW